MTTDDDDVISGLRGKFPPDRLNQLGRQLYTAVLCDILDDLGHRDQALDSQIVPLDDQRTLIGFARTMLTHEVYELPKTPYETEIAAVDALLPGDVVVVSTNRSRNNGFWGELMATAAVARGARGVVLEGAVRDIRRLREFGDTFPVFAAGRNPLDSKGRCLVSDFDRPVRCGGVLVHPGDLIFGDVDGVVAVPRDVVDVVVAKALDKVSGENAVRDDLRRGMLLKDAFAKHRIL
jgi:regulator of RNase E activity RraA